jgi:hypothetical protein
MNINTRLLLAMCAIAWFAGCETPPSASRQPDPPILVTPPPLSPSWTKEKEQRLENAKKKLQELEKENSQLEVSLNDALKRTITPEELKALREERNRLRERRDFLKGEIDALLIERGNKDLPYTGNR